MSQLYENIGVAFGDLDSCHQFQPSVYDQEEAVMLSRAGSVALKHRGSITSPRDELDLVVRQLNEHIASLSDYNAESPNISPRRQSFGGELTRHHTSLRGPAKSASAVDVRGIAAHHKRFDSNASTVTNSTDSATVFGGERSVSSHGSGGTGYYVRAKAIDETKHTQSEQSADTPIAVEEKKHHGAFGSDDLASSEPAAPLMFF
jgi:hypothetical protein